MANVLNLAGLALNLLGVWLLFLYVLPRRNRTGGYRYYGEEQPNPDLVRLERRWDWLSRIGLAAVTLGTLLQIIAIFLPALQQRVHPRWLILSVVQYHPAGHTK
jgi:hypothetical protein